MKAQLIQKVEFAARELPLGRFYRPDGSARPARIPPGSVRPRLLVVLSGLKRELMGFRGRAEKVTLYPGDFYFMDRCVWEECCFETVHDFLCVIPCGDMLRMVWYPIREPGPKTVWPANVAVETAKVPESLLNAFDILRGDEATRHPAVAAAAVRVILELALVELRNGVPPEESTQRLFGEMKRFLEENFTRGITRGDVARNFRRSPQYVSALFKRHSVQSFQRILDDLRIHEAKRLLRSTEYSVKEVAALCGYENGVYFVRRFRELAAMTPGRYRATR